jgi:hypothetical protein
MCNNSTAPNQQPCDDLENDIYSLNFKTIFKTNFGKDVPKDKRELEKLQKEVDKILENLSK